MVDIPLRYHGQQYPYIQEYQEDFISLVFLWVISICQNSHSHFCSISRWKSIKSLWKGNHYIQFQWKWSIGIGQFLKLSNQRWFLKQGPCKHLLSEDGAIEDLFCLIVAQCFLFKKNFEKSDVLSVQQHLLGLLQKQHQSEISTANIVEL